MTRGAMPREPFSLWVVVYFTDDRSAGWFVYTMDDKKKSTDISGP
jgi:hypothetical protein